MLITVTEDTSVVDQGTVVLFTGTDEQGRTVRFAADHRPAQDILAALQEESEIQAEVESWQILARSSSSKGSS